MLSPKPSDTCFLDTSEEAPLSPPAPVVSALELDAYRRLVEKHADKMDGYPIQNGTIEHCKIILAEMFRRASSLKIVSGNLNRLVYGSPEVIKAAQVFFKKPGHSFQALTEMDIDPTHPLLNLDRESGSIEIFRLAPEDRVIPFHFAIMDDCSTRLENDKLSYSAIAKFDNKRADTLVDLYEDLKQAAQA